MIINGIYQHHQQALHVENNYDHGQRSVKMEDLNNNVDSSANRNGSLMNGQNAMAKISNSDSEYSIKLKTEKSDSNQLASGAPKCANCLLPIEDKFICNMMNMYWHEECLTCSQCCCMLNQSCFFKNGQLFCKEDYFRNFGTRCNSCMDLIGPNELVMRIETLNTKQIIFYHLNCFKCLVCDKQLQKGEEYILRSEGIYCKFDFERCKLKTQLVGSSPSFFNGQQKLSNNSNSSFNSQPSEEENSVDSIKYRMVLASQTQNEQVAKKTSRRVTKRPRTILNAAQRYDFREAFKQSQKPCRKVREHLADKTGLSVRVVQVWFQNERAKMKKMQRRQQQMNKFGELETNGSKKKSSVKKSKKDSMSNEDDEDSMDEEMSEVDTDDLSDDEESLDLDESENRMNSQNLPQAPSFQPIQLTDADNIMPVAGYQHQTNENECMNLMNIQFNQQQHCQIQPNPINRLYSMQNSYF